MEKTKLINGLEIILETLLENINESVCIIDASGKVEYWNKGAEKLYDIKAYDILGRKIEKFFPNALCMAVLENGEKAEYVEHCPRAGAEAVISALPIENNGQRCGVISIDHEVTQFRKINSALYEAKKRLASIKAAENMQQIELRGFGAILCKSKNMLELIKLGKKVAQTEAAVIITGESGTGKDLFAKAIHDESSRRQGPFIVVDCSSIASNLLESELFGYEAGAFTGAQAKGKPGKFELADQGTLFLDEIGELPLEMQAKLLRSLENREFYRVGGIKPVKVNIRIIAATNRNMKQMVEEGAFREDLFYRLNVFSLLIPALRERKEDILLLAEFYLKQFALLNNKEFKEISEGTRDSFLEYKWPGNVRELKNIMERIVVLSEAKVIETTTAEIFGEKKSCKEKWQGTFKSLLELEESLGDIERSTILKALASANQNKVKAAKILAIPRSTLYYKMQKLGLLS